MMDAVFVSDLHLHPDRHDIESFFIQFTVWAKQVGVKKIYILGDFFHAWAGDDMLDEWSRSIAIRLAELAQEGIALFYMHGNRDFLLGKHFATLAHFTILSDPSVIYLGETPVLLTHGDRYCTKDKSHQYFRRITRNALFCWLFLHMPRSYRRFLVDALRKKSQNNQYKTAEIMDVTPDAVIKHMRKYNVSLLVHGHTHQPGLTTYSYEGHALKRYVLSDWDAIPSILCYDKTKGFFYKQNWLTGV